MGFFGKDSWGDGNSNGGGTSPEFVDASKIIESDEKQLISKVEKDQIELNKTALLSKIDSSQIGVANGVAKLNADGQVVDSLGNEIEGVVNSIEADKIIESPSKVLVSPSQRSQIESNVAELASHTQRLSDLQLALDNSISTDEKVAMDATSQASYLSELIDGLTLKNVNGKLTVEGLSGLIASINELNFLQGTTANIQQQINNLSGVSSFRGVFSNLTELQSAPSPQAGEYAIVSDGNMSDYYFYYGSNWDYSHATTGVSVIDIANGTTGLLPKVRYEKQNASETSFVDASGKIIATDTNSAIIEVFRFADSLLKGLTQTVGSPLSNSETLEKNLFNFKNWYSNVAEAITLKGVNTSTANNGDEIIQKIKVIPNISIEGSVKKKSKLNVSAGNNVEVQLSSALPLKDITTTLIEFIQGSTGVVAYSLEFNNTDSSNFEINNSIIFDGKMKLKKTKELNTLDETFEGKGFVKYSEVSPSKYESIKGFVFY